MQHRFFSGILPQEYKKRLQIAATAFSSTFRRVNLSLVSCSSAELTSVSVPCKIDFNKLHLQPVKKSSHLQVELVVLGELVELELLVAGVVICQVGDWVCLKSPTFLPCLYPPKGKPPRVPNKAPAPCSGSSETK